MKTLIALLTFALAAPALAQGLSREDLQAGKDRPAKTALERAARLNAERAADYEEVARPNVIFIIVDDEDRNRNNQYPEGRRPDGSPANLTPALDALADSGVVLGGMHVPSPVCIPSRFTLLTGTYGSRARNEEARRRFELHGYPSVGQNTHILPGGTRTLAHRLQDAGYTTGMVGKNHVVEVDDWVNLPADADINDANVQRKLAKNQEVLTRAFQQSGFDFSERIYHDNLPPNGPSALLAHNLDWITEGALEFLDEHHDEPFFLYFSSTLPHGPNAPRYTYLADRRITPAGMLDEPVKLLKSGWDIKKELEEAGITDGHAGNAIWVDSAVATLQAKLDELGIADETIIVYFNDHGVEQGKTSLFQGGVSTYAVVGGNAPWVAGGRRSEALLSSVDWMPTILSWAGVDVVAEPGPIDGVSFAPLLSGEVEQTRVSLYGEIGYSRSIRLGDWKYIALRPSEHLQNLTLEEKQANLDEWFRRRDRMGIRREANEATDPYPHIIDIPGGVDNTWGAMRKHPHYFDADQLYNLADDPGEQVNLAADPQYAGVLRLLRAELARQLAEFDGTFGEFGAEAGD